MPARCTGTAAAAASAAVRMWYSGCGSSSGPPAAISAATSLWNPKSWKGSGIVKRRVRTHANATSVAAARSVGTIRPAARPRPSAFILEERRA
jgi:hypothetical protein